MTYTIPPDSPKAAKAAAFGRELVRALQVRGVSMNEAGRAAGVGASALDHYRTGAVLPRTVVAAALADALDWPKLHKLIVEARTFPCQRPGCTRTFRNDTGAPRRYCSHECWRLNQKLRGVERMNRRAGQTGSPADRTRAATALRSGLRIAEERNVILMAAVADMCRGCEPEGVCRTEDCPLRLYSPLPLSKHHVSQPRTDAAVRAAAQTPEKLAAIAAGSRRRWAKPGERERQSVASRARWAALSPEERTARGQLISERRRAS